MQMQTHTYGLLHAQQKQKIKLIWAHEKQVTP